MATGGYKLHEKIVKYEEFVNETLKSELQRILTNRDEVYKKISELLQLRNIIEGIQLSHDTDKPMKTMVDLGCSFYAKAFVPDIQKIYVNIGLDCYTELTLDEAVNFINKREKLLESIVDGHTKKAVKIKADIRMVLEGLRELQMIDNVVEEPPQREIY